VGIACVSRATCPSPLATLKMLPSRRHSGKSQLYRQELAEGGREGSPGQCGVLGAGVLGGDGYIALCIGQTHSAVLGKNGFTVYSLYRNNPDLFYFSSTVDQT
jgi:hypothetical protein